MKTQRQPFLSVPFRPKGRYCRRGTGRGGQPAEAACRRRFKRRRYAGSRITGRAIALAFGRAGRRHATTTAMAAITRRAPKVAHSVYYGLLCGRGRRVGREGGGLAPTPSAAAIFRGSLAGRCRSAVRPTTLARGRVPHAKRAPSADAVIVCRRSERQGRQRGAIAVCPPN